MFDFDLELKKFKPAGFFVKYNYCCIYKKKDA